jgi:flagellar basal-body rod protein FlgF
MDNSMLVGLQAQRVLQRRLDVTANNLANAATSGFKSDALTFAMLVKKPAAAEDNPRDVRFVADNGMIRNMGQGSISRTGSAFDVALEGDGFFMVQAPDGRTAYTRDGSFTLSADGTLMTTEGHPVLSQGGAPIVLDPQGSSPMIDKTGAISIEGVEAGQLGVAAFANASALEKIGDNMFVAGAQPPQISEARVVQFALEGSNVRPVVELTRLIEISRAYESAAKFVKNSDDMRKSAMERLNRL